MLRVYGYMFHRYRRTWRGTITSSFLYPLMYLLAMGIGLGHLVNHHLAGASSPVGFSRLGGVGYVTFIAPGLLAATAMQMATNESTYPVMEGVKWARTYLAMLAAPIEARDVQRGQLLWIATRVAISGAVFLAIMAAFGDVLSPYAVLALVASTLTGMAFAAPVAAFAVTRENSTSFPIMYRLGIVPLFLFSGTFFPITNLPGWLQVIARVTPLYHGVELCRALVLGQMNAASLAVDTGYLACLVLFGVYFGGRTFAKRLAQ